MLRSASARFWQITLWLILLGALVTASIGGVAAGVGAFDETPLRADSVSSAPAKKPTETPTRQPKKTKTPTETPDVSPTRLSTETPVATETPSDTLFDTPALPPGVYHFNGTIRNIAKNALQWRTARGTFNVTLTPQSNLWLDGERIAAHALQKGQRLDGLIRADESGKLTGLTLTARTAHPIATGGGTKNGPLPEADTGSWSAPLDVAAGVNASQTPILAAESASGSAAVWYADLPQPGFYYSVRIGESDTWTEPQFLDFTSAADGQPALALDYQRQLHLVWEHADRDGTQIRYAAATFDPVNLTLTWNEPVTLSDVTTSAVNPALAVSDWNAQPRVHAVWLEAQAGDAETTAWNIVTRHADSPAHAWSAPFTFDLAPSSFAHPALAATYGKVAVAYPEAARLTYRECDLEAAEGDCARLEAWSGGERATRERPDAVSLALDTGGNAHLVWRGATDATRNQILARRRDAAGHWSEPNVLRQLPADTAAGVVPLVTADTPDQVYAVWKALTANGAAPDAAIEYAHFDGAAWSAPLSLTTQTRAQNDAWGGLVMDTLGALHVLWRARGTKLYYAAQSVNPNRAASNQAAPEDLTAVGPGSYEDNDSHMVYVVTAHPIMYQASSAKLRHAQLAQNTPSQLG